MLQISMNNFEKPSAFNISFHRPSIISSLADLEVSGIKKVEDVYIDLMINEMLERLAEEVPELRKAVQDRLKIYD